MLKIIGIVLLSLLLLIFILTLFSVKVYVDFDKKSVRLSVKYLWLQLFKLDTSENKPETKKPSDEASPPQDKPESYEPEIEISEITETPDEQSPKSSPQKKEEPKSEEAPEKPENPKTQEEPEDEKKSGSSLMDKWNVVKGYLPKVKTALKKLLKLIKINDLELHMTVGGDDAATAGQNFGKINAVFYNALALLCCLFSVRIRKTEIRCDYENKGFDVNGSVLIKARVLSIVALAVYILINYLKVKSALDKLDKPEPESNTRKKD